MTEYDVEERLRAWYRTEVNEREAPPDELRLAVAAIAHARVVRPFDGRRNLVLLVAAALVAAALIGGAIAVGSGIRRLSVLPPRPEPSLNTRPGPSAGSDLIAFTWGGRIETIQADGTHRQVLSTESGSISGLHWSPDGRWLIWFSQAGTSPPEGGYTKGAPTALVAIAVDGSQHRTLLKNLIDPSTPSEVVWGADSAWLAVSSGNGCQSTGGTCVVRLDGTRLPTMPSSPAAETCGPVWPPLGGGRCPSPDGKAIAYVRYPSLATNIRYPEVRMAALAGTDDRLLTTLHIDDQQVSIRIVSWTRDGSEVVYELITRSTGSAQVWAVGRDGGEPHPITIPQSGLLQGWSPDWRWMLLTVPVSTNGSQAHLVVADADGSNPRNIDAPIDGVVLWQPLP